MEKPIMKNMTQHSIVATNHLTRDEVACEVYGLFKKVGNILVAIEGAFLSQLI